MATSSVIGPTTVIVGSIRGEGDLEILGRVEGSVVVQGEVTIGDGALVKSDVRARRVIVRGAVRGHVSADELLILEAGARVLGDLGAPQVGIRPGGLVKGHVSTAGPLPLERPKPVAATRAAPAPARPVAAASRPAAPPAHAVPRPAAAPARPVPPPRAAPPVAPPVEHRPPAHVEHRPPAHVEHRAQNGAAVPAPPPSSPSAVEAELSAEPPPPVVPALPKGARASMRKKAGK
jgi:cytoskeletal protein CcmA (bactofilin family)